MKLNIGLRGASVSFGDMFKGPLRLVSVGVVWAPIKGSAAGVILCVADYDDAVSSAKCRFQRLGTFFFHHPSRSFIYRTGA